jgi:ABC-type multidrug transport system ATPase subunit
LLFFTSIYFDIIVSLSRSIQKDDIVIQDDHVVAMGGLQRVDLGFRGIRLELETKTKKQKTSATSAEKTTTRTILDGSIHGRAQPGRMLAIMGPSGAGKSSVLHAVAGRIKERPNVALYGERFINGQLVSGDSMIPSAFVPQEVNFFPYMTVRETLTFRIELKLGSRLSKTARTVMVTDLMEQVNLHDVADTIVGGTKVRGISGGERRRLMIACELISSPAVLFLDEPTTGLDSTAAASLVDTLRALADSGKTIIAVIHQPSQNIFASFDDLLLVAQGKQMYFGKVTSVRKYMAEHGCKAPLGIGTAEHVLDCVSVEPLPSESEEEALERVDRLAQAAMVQPVNLGPMDLDGGSDGKALKFAGHQLLGGPKANIFIQFKLLLKRALRESFRGKAKIILQVVQQVSLGLIYGGIYTIGTNQVRMGRNNAPTTQINFGRLDGTISLTSCCASFGNAHNTYIKRLRFRIVLASYG